MRRIAIAVVLCVIATTAYARPRRSYASYATPSSVGDNSTAQGVAEWQARDGVVAHHGGNRGYEGCGCGPTPESALNNCCYSNSGMPVVDQGVAYGHGRWFACKRFGR